MTTTTRAANVSEPPPLERPALSPYQWLACAIAAMGFLFDTYEIVVQSLIARPAVTELSGARALLNVRIAQLLYVPFLAGGAAGLLGGALIDRFGRRTLLVWSILLYGAASLAAGLATSLPALLLWRCLTVIGVCVETIAALAWLAELFGERRQRESALGYTQLLSSFGGITVAIVYYVTVTHGAWLPEIRGGHSAWRYTLLFGALPAVVIAGVAGFLPESPRWREIRSSGWPGPRLREIFRPELLRSTLMAAALAVCIFAAAFGVFQQIPQIVTGLPAVQSLPPIQQQQAVATTRLFQDAGNILGRAGLAVLAVVVISRRRLLSGFLVPAAIITPLLMLYAARISLPLFQFGVLLGTLLLNAQMSFLGNYIPQLYPTRLRGIGQGFAFNAAGRIVGTSAVLLTAALADRLAGAGRGTKLAVAAAIVSAIVYLLSLVIARRLPELESEPQELAGGRSQQ